MNKKSQSFDSIWEDDIYGKGSHLNRYPFDVVINFVYHNCPRDKPRDEIRILEVGCGAGNNLWFAAREGFRVTGIDGSTSAIDYATNRFAQDGLTGDFQIGDFTKLPFEDNSFDLAIDRAAITCCGLSSARKAVDEVRRVLHDSGKFLFNAYSASHSSNVSGRAEEDGLTLDISEGSLVGAGQICFYGRREIDEMFQDWKVLSIQHMEITEEIAPKYMKHAEWRVIAEKRK